MGSGNASNSKLLDLCLIEIGVTVTLEIEALLCGIEFRSHRCWLYLILNPTRLRTRLAKSKSISSSTGLRKSLNKLSGPQKNPVTHNDPHLKGPGSSRIGSRLWSIDPGSWSRQPIAPKKVAGWGSRRWCRAASGRRARPPMIFD